MIYKSLFNKLSVLALILLIPGCIWGSVQHDRTLKKEMIQSIETGKTTRNNILKWFGPPGILAKKDGTALIPSLEAGPEKMQKVDSKVFFKYFFKTHSISKHHIVYYYFDEWEKINGLSIPIGNTLFSLPLTSTDLQFSELWVLLNSSTGQVEDYVFLEAEEK